MVGQADLDKARKVLIQWGWLIAGTRRARGISQRQLGEQLGIRHDWLSRIEKGTAVTSPEEARILTEWMLQRPESDQQAADG